MRNLRVVLPLILTFLFIAVCQAEVEPGPADKNAPKTFTTTPSGLRYRILRKTGGKKPQVTSKVKVHYKGWLFNDFGDKKEFDSSYKRSKPAVFPLNAVIKGWTEGLQLVGEGEMIEIVIPSELAYGKKGAGPIPPDTDLHFLVELIEVKE